MSKIVSKALGKAMMLQERKLAVTANNLANIRTPGYKAIQASQDAQKSAELIGETGQVAVPVMSSYISFSGGPLMETGAKLDMAIEGNGFFVVATRSGIRYTRNGQFSLNETKHLVTPAGDQVMGDNGAIVIDGRDVAIEADGTIYVDKQLAGKVKVVDFEEKRYLEHVGTSLFANTNEDNREVAAEKYSVRQGFCEASNVNVTQEMINLVTSHRCFEAYDKMKKLAGDASQKLMEIAATK